MTETFQAPITLKDIALRAGVSSVTTGRVLLGSGQGSVRVGKKTAERIRKIASELNYSPNLTARQLAGASSKLIGAIIDSFASDAGRTMLMTIERTVAQHGYRLLVGFMHEDFDRIRGYVDDFRGRGVDGVISMAHNYPGFGEKVPQLFSSFKNCVFIDRPMVDNPFSSVDMDNEYAGHLLTRHLLNLGRRRIAMSSLNYRVPVICDREAGYKRAYREMGLPIDPALIYKGSMAYIQSLEAANQCLDGILQARPDAILTGSDEVAIWFIEALQDRGICVPRDCAVASFTHIQACRGFRPTLTTTNMEYEEVALKAINLLLSDIEMGEDHRPVKQNVLVRPKLIIGQSCGAN